MCVCVCVCVCVRYMYFSEYVSGLGERLLYN